LRRLARPATARTSRAPDPLAPTAQRICSLPCQVLTHSWDGSQIYGVDALGQGFLREHSGGKLRMENGLPPHSTDPQQDPTRKPSFWPALVTMQTPFAEHNATAEHRLEHYPACHLRRPRSALEARGVACPRLTGPLVLRGAPMDRK
jgi:hypothetical protein